MYPIEYNSFTQHVYVQDKGIPYTEVGNSHLFTQDLEVQHLDILLLPTLPAPTHRCG
jgi:hypothetical protein